MSEWDFPKRQQTFNPAGTKFEQVFQDQIALIAYAQYRSKHLVSKRENEWLPHFALTFAEFIRKEAGKRQISLEKAVEVWKEIWLGHPRSSMLSFSKWQQIIEPILPFIRGELILAFTTDEKSGKFFLVTRSDRIIFHLAKSLPDVQPQSGSFYEDFKAGIKTSEWRDASPYWLKRLCDLSQQELWGMDTCNLTDKLKVHRAWFVEGYPKGNLPRLEADITGAFYHPTSKQLEIQIANMKEAKQG